MTRPSLAGVERGDYAWEVKCPTCGAAPGRPCYGNGEMPRHMTHGARAAVRLKALTAAVRDVLARHAPEWPCGNPAHTNPDVGCPECEDSCADCGQSWPCPTVRALAAHLDLTDPEGDPT